VGQKVNPVGFRVGVYVPWTSRWFAKKKGIDTYGKNALEDVKIRRYLESQLEGAEIASIEIEKMSDSIRIILHSARPGMVIGKKGQEIDSLRKDIARLMGGNRSVDITVEQVKNPDVDATLIAKSIATQLEKRANFKKVMKRAVMTAARAGAKGIKIRCKGRLGGAEIARAEFERWGSVPLHTLRSKVDYSYQIAKTTYGVIGVQVWVCTGEIHMKK